ncbi:MAG TPA: DUF5684 domain-containing protein [Phycisphaerae bacterium]|nr:DUF5684 domain-containing protein [Phycisphaerae bacterium]HUT57482.1 DUF5684 domain-containing protein [Phycisphaerae bacterium]
MQVILPLIYIALLVLVIAGAWKMFAKAGKPGWAAIVPIYNFVVILEIVGKPVWWVVLTFIPVANLIISIIVMIELAKVFGKGAGFGIGLAFLGFIFIPILGFGSAKYIGTAGAAPPAAAPPAPPAPPQ